MSVLRKTRLAARAKAVLARVNSSNVCPVNKVLSMMTEDLGLLVWPSGVPDSRAVTACAIIGATDHPIMRTLDIHFACVPSARGARKLCLKDSEGCNGN